MAISEVLFVLGLPAVTVTGYLGILGLVAGPPRAKATKAIEVVQRPYLTVVVPAHNEAKGIARTIESIKSVDYPQDRFSVLVIADNCTDDTKERAEQAGARVLERRNLAQRGKGYALDYAFETLISEGHSDGLVVVDADTDVSSNILNAMAIRLLEGEGAVQAHYGVRNVDDSWRTRLMDVAFTLYHGVRSTARERLSLSAGLRGNGMAFSIDTLRKVPYRSYSLVEDVEYGIELGLNGIRVAYAGEAEVRGEMVSGGEASESQRRRWEQGRRGLIVRYAPRLLARAVRERNAVLFDLALDLLTPPLTALAVFTVIGSTVAIGTVGAGISGPAVVVPWVFSAAGLVTYMTKGIRMSRHGMRVALDMVHIPKYMLWKMGLRFRKAQKRSDEWVRTAREGEECARRPNEH